MIGQALRPHYSTISISCSRSRQDIIYLARFPWLPNAIWCNQYNPRSVNILSHWIMVHLPFPFAHLRRTIAHKEKLTQREKSGTATQTYAPSILVSPPVNRVLPSNNSICNRGNGKSLANHLFINRRYIMIHSVLPSVRHTHNPLLFGELRAIHTTSSQFAVFA